MRCSFYDCSKIGIHDWQDEYYNGSELTIGLLRLCESCNQKHFSIVESGRICRNGSGSEWCRWTYFGKIPDIIPWNPEGDTDVEVV